MKKSHIIFNWEYIAFALLVICGGIGLFFGWKLFWFLTDDAYIAFRYVSNSLLGYGYVWNPPPFMPVEGYTSFLWVILLDVVWRITGVAPPLSSNMLSFVFSYLTLILYALMVMAIPAFKSIKKWRIVLVAFLLVYLLLNRTFLTWASSGLETALFNFLLTVWIGVLLFIRNYRWRVGLGSLLSAVLALTRPDGLLFCAAILAIMFIEVLRTSTKRDATTVFLCGMLPLGIVFTHQIWRISFYGAWLPNTYYAKVVSAWPKSGILYALSFMLEYSLWFAVIIICWALVTILPKTRSWTTRSLARGEWVNVMKKTIISHGTQFLIIATLLSHLSYYTFIVGGDHFEYRVYSYVIPLIFLALVWSLSRLNLKPLTFLGFILGFVLLSMPVQWTHWILTKDLNTREETHVMVVPIAKMWPAPFRFYAELFDKTQSWLIPHHVGMRHQEHKIFWKTQIKTWPSRDEGILISLKGFPVVALYTVGVPSWTLPNVSIIDVFGLNDYVVARTPIDNTNFRLMAHSRHPPKGYVEDFRPNIKKVYRKIYIEKRYPPFTEDDIKKIETSWRKRIEKNIEQSATTDARTSRR